MKQYNYYSWDGRYTFRHHSTGGDGTGGKSIVEVQREGKWEPTTYKTIAALKAEAVEKGVKLVKVTQLGNKLLNKAQKNRKRRVAARNKSVDNKSK